MQRSIKIFVLVLIALALCLASCGLAASAENAEELTTRDPAGTEYQRLSDQSFLVIYPDGKTEVREGQVSLTVKESPVTSTPTISSKSPTATATSENILSKARKSFFPSDEEIREDAFVLVNEARKDAGLPALVKSSRLGILAKEHTLNMIKTRVLSHDGFDSRATRSGYPYTAENVAKGYHSAESLVDGWLSSPGHKANIMDRDLTHTGLYYESGFATQFFGGK